MLRRCQQGDETALVELIRHYEKRVFRFTLRVSGDSSLAEEATVDCFYRVWTKCRQKRGDGNLDAWIFQIAHRTLLDLIRRRRRWLKRMFAGSRTDEHDLRPTPLETLIETEQQQRLAHDVASAIRTLKEDDRALVHLYYFEGRSLAEIADVLETSRDALKRRRLRARNRLGNLLESDDDHR